MFAKLRLRQIVLCLGLEMIALLGIPMRPEEFEDLLRAGRETKVERLQSEEEKDSIGY